MTGVVPSRRAMRAAVLAVLAAVSVGACGGSATPRSNTGAHSFVDLVAELPTDLDETGTPDAASTALIPSWSSELVRPATTTPGAGATITGDDAVVPYLATSWRLDPGGDYTFTLRPGVRGATGDPLTAADVDWSLRRAIARSPLAPYLFSLAHIDTADPVTILGHRTVRINVTRPSPFTLAVLSSADVQIYDSRLYRAHASAADPWAQQWGRTHSGSYGPYVVSSFVPKSEIVLDANPGFWRRPFYSQVTIKQVPTSAARLAELDAGTATHTSSLSWPDFGSVVNDSPGGELSATIVQTGPAVLAWHLGVTKGPLANPLVRSAINLGINRVELANALDGGYAAPTQRTVPAFFGTTQPSVFNPVAARSLLRAAGYPNGVQVDVTTDATAAGPGVGTLLRLLYAQLIQIGVILNTTYVDDADQLLALEQRHEVASSIDTVAPLLGGPAFLLEQNVNAALDPASPAADERYANPALTGLLALLGDTAAGPAADALVEQAAAIVDRDLPTINLVALPVQNVTQADVVGYRASTQPVTYYEDLHPRR